MILETPVASQEIKNLSYEQAARRLNTTKLTIGRWVSAGKIRARKFSPKIVRIPVEEIERLEREALV